MGEHLGRTEQDVTQVATVGGTMITRATLPGEFRF
jgi:hypothetical protein